MHVRIDMLCVRHPPLNNTHARIRNTTKKNITMRLQLLAAKWPPHLSEFDNFRYFVQSASPMRSEC